VSARQLIGNTMPCITDNKLFLSVVQASLFASSYILFSFIYYIMIPNISNKGLILIVIIVITRFAALYYLFKNMIGFRTLNVFYSTCLIVFSLLSGINFYYKSFEYYYEIICVLVIYLLFFFKSHALISSLKPSFLSCRMFVFILALFLLNLLSSFFIFDSIYNILNIVEFILYPLTLQITLSTSILLSICLFGLSNIRFSSYKAAVITTVILCISLICYNYYYNNFISDVRQIAITSNETKMLALLLINNCNIYYNGYNTPTPLEYAIKNGSDTTTEWILNFGSITSTL